MSIALPLYNVKYEGDVVFYSARDLYNKYARYISITVNCYRFMSHDT